MDVTEEEKNRRSNILGKWIFSIYFVITAPEWLHFVIVFFVQNQTENSNQGMLLLTPALYCLGFGWDKLQNRSPPCPAGKC